MSEAEDTLSTMKRLRIGVVPTERGWAAMKQGHDDGATMSAEDGWIDDHFRYGAERPTLEEAVEAVAQLVK